MDFSLTISATRPIRTDCSRDEQLCKDGTPLCKNTPIKHSTFRKNTKNRNKQLYILVMSFLTC